MISEIWLRNAADRSKVQKYKLPIYTVPHLLYIDTRLWIRPMPGFFVSYVDVSDNVGTRTGGQLTLRQYAQKLIRGLVMLTNDRRYTDMRGIIRELVDAAMTVRSTELVTIETAEHLLPPEIYSELLRRRI